MRWTEQRNFEAILDLMASGAVNVKPLVSHLFTIDDAKAAYEKLDDRHLLVLFWITAKPMLQANQCNSCT